MGGECATDVIVNVRRGPHSKLPRSWCAAASGTVASSLVRHLGEYMHVWKWPVKASTQGNGLWLWLAGRAAKRWRANTRVMWRCHGSGSRKWGIVHLSFGRLARASLITARRPDLNHPSFALRVAEIHLTDPTFQVAFNGRSAPSPLSLSSPRLEGKPTWPLKHPMQSTCEHPDS